MAVTYTDNYNFTIQQSGASASDKFSMAALNDNAKIADAEIKKIDERLTTLEELHNKKLESLIDGSVDNVKSNAITVRQYAFAYCGNLSSVSLPLATSIGTYAFAHCGSLISLTLRANEVCALADGNAFASTPIASGNGNIYVPSTLVDSYKADTKWATYAAQIIAIDDLAGS